MYQIAEFAKQKPRVLGEQAEWTLFCYKPSFFLTSG